MISHVTCLIYWPIFREKFTQIFLVLFPFIKAFELNAEFLRLNISVVLFLFVDGSAKMSPPYESKDKQCKEVYGGQHCHKEIIISGERSPNCP